MSVAYFRNYLESVEKKIKIDWNDKNALSEYRNSIYYGNIVNHRRNFNSTIAFCALAIYHTGFIYSTKKVLHKMNRSLLRIHLFACFTIGSFGGVLGSRFCGKNKSNTTRANNLIKALDSRIEEL